MHFRLEFEDIQAGTSQVPGGEGVDQRLLVDQGATPRVDQHRARLHLCQSLAIHQVAIAGGEGAVQTDDVGAPQQVRQLRAVCCPQCLLRLGFARRPVIENAHAEPPRPSRHRLADCTQADDSEGSAVYPVAERARAEIPPPGTQGALAIAELATGGQYQGERQVGSILGDHGRIAHRHTPHPGGLDIDIVCASSDIGYQPDTARHALDQGGGHWIDTGRQVDRGTFEHRHIHRGPVDTNFGKGLQGTGKRFGQFPGQHDDGPGVGTHDISSTRSALKSSTLRIPNSAMATASSRCITSSRLTTADSPPTARA